MGDSERAERGQGTCKGAREGEKPPEPEEEASGKHGPREMRDAGGPARARAGQTEKVGIRSQRYSYNLVPADDSGMEGAGLCGAQGARCEHWVPSRNGKQGGSTGPRRRGHLQTSREYAEELNGRRKRIAEELPAPAVGQDIGCWGILGGVVVFLAGAKERSDLETSEWEGLAHWAVIATQRNRMKHGPGRFPRAV